MPRDCRSSGSRSLVITADVCKWNGKLTSHGMSLAVVIPPEVVAALVLREGSAVRVSLEDVLADGIPI